MQAQRRMTKWHLYMKLNPDGDSMKPMYVPPELYSDMRGLVDAHHEPDAVTRLDELSDYAFVEVGGMCSQKRTIWSAKIGDDLEVNIPATDFGVFHEQLRGAALEPDPVPHYALVGWLHMMVLTPALRDELLAEMDNDAPTVTEVAQRETVALAKARTELHEAGVLAPPPPPKPINGDWN